MQIDENLKNKLVDVHTSSGLQQGWLEGVYTLNDETIVHIKQPALERDLHIRDWRFVAKSYGSHSAEIIRALDRLNEMGVRDFLIAKRLGVTNSLISSRWRKGQAAEKWLAPLNQLINEVKTEKNQ